LIFRDEYKRLELAELSLLDKQEEESHKKKHLHHKKASPVASSGDKIREWVNIYCILTRVV
jgi:sodium/potassium-transporting ATPase subunit alpha